MSATNECERLVDLLVRTDDIPQLTSQEASQ
jgi:hypothetical protein